MDERQGSGFLCKAVVILGAAPSGAGEVYGGTFPLQAGMTQRLSHVLQEK